MIVSNCNTSKIFSFSLRLFFKIWVGLIQKIHILFILLKVCSFTIPLSKGGLNGLFFRNSFTICTFNVW